LATLAQFIESEQGSGKQDGVELKGAGDVSFTTALERFEADLLVDLLRRHGGSIEAAAREAGMNMVTMYRKIKKYGIRKGDYN
jgi:transcriptional regulator of acetoin/glycerol metabolism